MFSCLYIRKESVHLSIFNWYLIIDFLIIVNYSDSYRNARFNWFWKEHTRLSKHKFVARRKALAWIHRPQFFFPYNSLIYMSIKFSCLAWENLLFDQFIKDLYYKIIWVSFAFLCVKSWCIACWHGSISFTDAFWHNILLSFFHQSLIEYIRTKIEIKMTYANMLPFY